ncbi:MAG: hypothetical protein VX874_06325 [Pseudomonadota bacterium]|nr:hypothetical protein [Pseudomonadota bacterium]
MQVEYIDGEGGVWMFDRVRAYVLIDELALVKALVDNTTIITKDNWFSADEARVHTNHNRVAADRLNNYSNFARRFQRTLDGGLQDTQDFLVECLFQKDLLNKQLYSKYNDPHAFNRRALQTIKDSDEDLKFWKDTALFGLSVLAVVSTGGVAFVVITAANMAANAYVTYDETGSWEKAAASGALAAIPGGGKVIGKVVQNSHKMKKVAAAVTTVIEEGADIAHDMYVNDAAIEDAVASKLVSKGVSHGYDRAAKHASKFVSGEVKSALKTVQSKLGSSEDFVVRVSKEATKKVVTGTANDGLNELGRQAKSVIKSAVEKGPSSPLEATYGAEGARAVNESGVRQAFSGANNPIKPMADAPNGASKYRQYIVQHVLARVD